jgi:hypothetical protein
MSVKRLYLIRRDTREFLGPMTADEFKEKISRMEFGLQDEISGHCGPWVVLDQIEPVQQHYPEIAALLSQNLPLSWREITGHAKVISRQDARRDSGRGNRNRKSTSSRESRRRDYDDLQEYILKNQRRKNRNLIIALCSVALIAAGIYAFNSRKDDAMVSTAEASALASRPDTSEFMSYMGLKVIPGAGKMIRNPKNSAAWLPYLRMYAFHSTGSVEGVPQKTLRGELPSSAPLDCGVDTLKKRWRENSSQIVTFVQGKSLSKNTWTRILALDPHWIRRRYAKGWIKPRNYYEGCLQMALTSVRSLSSDTNLGADPNDQMTPEILNQVNKRLQSQLEILATGKSTVPSDLTSVTGVLTCYDSAQSMMERDTCKRFGDGSFNALFDERGLISILRVIELSDGLPDVKSSAALKDASQRFPSEDFMSRNELVTEGKFIAAILSGLTVEQAIAKVEAENGDIKFRP